MDVVAEISARQKQHETGFGLTSKKAALCCSDRCLARTMAQSFYLLSRHLVQFDASGDRIDLQPQSKPGTIAQQHFSTVSSTVGIERNNTRRTGLGILRMQRTLLQPRIAGRVFLQGPNHDL